MPASAMPAHLLPALRRLAGVLLGAGTLAAAQAQTVLPLYLSATNASGVAGATDGVPSATLSPTAPSGTLQNLDPARDSADGLWLVRGGSGENENNATRHQRWLGPTGGTSIAGAVRLWLFSAMKDFNTAQTGSVIASLRNCDAAGASCTLITKVQVTLSPWHISSGWAARVIDFGSVSATLASDRRLELKVVAHNDSQGDMWLAYGAAATPSRLELTTVSSGCGALGTTADHPLYGAKKLTLETLTTVNNGSTTSTAVSGDVGKALMAATGARFDPNPTPVLPALLPAAFPVNTATVDITTTAATGLAPGYYDTVTVNAAGPLSFSPGTYHIDKLELKDNASVVFAPGTYFIREFRISRFTSATLSGSSTVRLNLGGPVVIGDDNAMNAGGMPTRLQLFVYPGVDLSVGKRLHAAALIYSPDPANKVDIDDEAVFSGAVIGQEVKLQQKSAVTYTATTRNAIAAVNTCVLDSVDHYQLTAPASALACVGTTLTVTACMDASSPCTNPATMVAGQTALLSTSGGSLGSGTLTFNAGGSASTTLAWPAASDGASATVTLSGEATPGAAPRRCCVGGTACSAANSCSITFNTAGLIVAAASGGAATTVPTQTAAVPSGSLVLRAVRTATSTAACEAALTGTRTVNWGLECSNPATCSAGNRMTLTGSAAVAIATNASGGSSNRSGVAMNFDANGNAPFSFSYADVGQVRLHATVPAAGSLLAPLSGSSNAFVVRPAGFVLSDIRCSSYAPGACATAAIASPGLNPGAATAAGAAFLPAGAAFRATVTAVDQAGNAVPNYGRETAPEGVVLAATLLQPAGGSAGTLANASGFGAFSAGVATGSGFSYSEVGIVTLTPSVADGNYLGAGNVTGTASGPVGRFVPARFVAGAGSVAHRVAQSCSPASTFSYLGENFRLALTLTAQNTAGATTANYQGAFAKFDPTQAGAWQLAGVASDGSTTTAFGTGNGRLSLGSATGSWVNGVLASATLTASALRAASPDGPHLAGFGIAPVDSDGVALAAPDLAVTAPYSSPDRTRVATVALRQGRLRLDGAIGPADRPLALPVTAQFWNGSAWATHTLDSCSTVPAAAVSFGQLGGALTAADAAVAAPVALAAGRGSLRLAAPGGSRRGAVSVALSLGSGAADASCMQPWTPASGRAATVGAQLPALRAAWCGGSGADKDPAARAVFGRASGNEHLVFRQERY